MADVEVVLLLAAGADVVVVVFSYTSAVDVVIDVASRLLNWPTISFKFFETFGFSSVEYLFFDACI